MGTGWRRAFCTSIRRNPDTVAVERSPEPSPRSCAKLSFFSNSGGGSNPSTARSRNLRCRTKSTPPESPKLQCKTAMLVNSGTSPPPTSPKRSPTLFRRGSSNMSSPRSHSTFAIFKAALHLSRIRCVICAQSVKAGGGTAVFTAECSHAFHFPCIAAHVRSSGGGALTCPVCSASWRQAPFLSSLGQDEPHSPVLVGDRKPLHCRKTSREDKHGGGEAEKRRPVSSAPAVKKVYDDDEPLLPSTRTTQGGANVRFNPIPEADEDDDDGGHEGGELEAHEEEFHGFLTKDNNNNNSNCSRSPSFRATAGARRVYAGGLEVSVMPEAALVSSGRKHRNYVVALKVKAPPAALLLSRCRRAPIDLVTVLDVSGGMTGAKIQMLKRAMRQVISSLGPADRLSVVAFSAFAAKRLLHLRRMSRSGQRSARLIVERLVASGDGQGSCVGDALRKATKVLEDRRERNPVATIMLLSDGQQQRQQRQDANKDGRRYARYPSSSSAAVTTRFAHLEIPIHASGFGDVPQRQQSKHSNCLAAPVEDAFAKCVGGLASVVMQDVRLHIVFPSGEVSAVYSGCGREVALGSSVRLGDLYAEEEWELLVELRVPMEAAPGHHLHSLTMKCRYRDPSTQEVICGSERTLLLPPLQSQGHPLLACSASSISLRLRNLFVTTRAVAESRRLAELSDYATALHLLSSARSLLLQSPAACDQDQDLIRRLEAELADIQLQRGGQQQPLSPCQRRREATIPGGEQQQLTPTSAWRAAEQLAKVAIMRKSLNRISDLHGFENARF